MNWNDERTEKLVQLWKEGVSASKIASELGGVTRNAVIGKIHRLKITCEGRETTRAKASTTPKPASASVDRRRIAKAGKAVAKIQARQRFPEMEAIEVPVVAEPYVLPETTFFGSAAILGITESTCKWPIGDPMMDDFRFCCASKGGDATYCDHHARMAYQTVSSRSAVRKAA